MYFRPESIRRPARNEQPPLESMGWPKVPSTFKRGRGCSAREGRRSGSAGKVKEGETETAAEAAVRLTYEARDAESAHRSVRDCSVSGNASDGGDARSGGAAPHGSGDP